MRTSAIGVVARLRRSTPPAAPAGERCELCGRFAGAEHAHAVDTVAGRLLCVCGACALLFERPGAGGGRYRSVRGRWERAGTHESLTGVLDALEIPVGVAFFVRRGASGDVAAFYPGPAGVTESSLFVDGWDARRLAELASLEPDVEALLVRRGPETTEGYIVPVDICYALAGRLRTCWRGFDGGAEGRRTLDAFFADVRSRAS